MALSHQEVATRWVDDLLDLYLNAVQTGDVEWQQQILERLQNKESLIKQEIDQISYRSLLKRFDEINNKMLAMYEEIRINGNAHLQQLLREQAWELKQERLKIMIQMKERSITTTK